MYNQDIFHVEGVDNSILVFERSTGRLYFSKIAMSNSYMVKCRNNNNDTVLMVRIN